MTPLGRGYLWMDAGTVDSLAAAGDFVREAEKRTARLISAPEEIAYGNGWLSKEQLLQAAERYGTTDYGRRLKQAAEDPVVF